MGYLYAFLGLPEYDLNHNSVLFSIDHLLCGVEDVDPSDLLSAIRLVAGLGADDGAELGKVPQHLGAPDGAVVRNADT